MVNKSPSRKEYSGVQQFVQEKSSDHLRIYDGHHLRHPLENEDHSTGGGRYHSPRKNQMMKKTSFVIVLVALPLLLVAITLGWIIVPCFIRSQIANKVVISPEANPELYAAWISPPIPVYLKIYLFNVTNPEQVRLGGLPNLEQVGPYVFLENRTKIDISHDESSDTITYMEYISYHFQPNMSEDARLTDVVTIINVPFAAAAIKIAQDLPWPVKGVAQTLLNSYKEPLFINRTVDEALFNGWTVPFLQKIEEDFGITVIPDNKFGFFIGQNATAQGPYTISRGTHDKSTFGAILKFKNESTLSVWGDPSNSCNRLSGTDGTIFPPFVTKGTTLRLFNAELCRSLYLTYDKDTSFDGIKGYRFIAPQSVLKDPRESEENRCFCADVDDYPANCLSQGALDLGPCRDGAPVALSTPHFLDAYPEYINMSGLTPIRDQHETFMDIEPLTGLILQASKKIQINLILKRVNGMSLLKRVPEMLFPLVWADECASLDAENAAKFKETLFQLWLFDFLAKWVLLGIALIISLVLITRRLRVRKGQSENKDLGGISKKNESSQQVPLTRTVVECDNEKASDNVQNQSHC